MDEPLALGTLRQPGEHLRSLGRFPVPRPPPLGFLQRPGPARFLGHPSARGLGKPSESLLHWTFEPLSSLPEPRRPTELPLQTEEPRRDPVWSVGAGRTPVGVLTPRGSAPAL